MEEIFQTFMNLSQEEMVNAATKLREKTPAPMNTMLEKQSQDEAIKKKEERSQMVVKDVPPTTPGTALKHSQPCLENCEHLKYFRNVDCVVTNHSKVQDT